MHEGKQSVNIKSSTKTFDANIYDEDYPDEATSDCMDSKPESE